LDNQTWTENADLTNSSSRNPLVDLFYDLSEHCTAGELKDTLQNAWKEDPLLTLKIIFNARSIHLGKSSRSAAYGALAWLANYHPTTFLANLQWLVRPIIEKNRSKSVEAGSTVADDDFEMIAAEEATIDDPMLVHDVRQGASHGYWKDLLNLLVFAANDQLKLDGDFSSLLNQLPNKSTRGKRKRGCNQETARELRRTKNREQNGRVQEKLNNDPFYRALHVKIAQLFAEQLKIDKALLDSGKRADIKKLSLAAKWAPTFGEFHDKHTFVLSSIAEILFPDPELHCQDAGNRELYLRHIRELFRKQYSSPLRKALGVVERDIVAGTFENIEFSRVPSLAMDRYTNLFISKDHDHFTKFVSDVSTGDASISGATLLPSTLVRKACEPIASKFTQGKKKIKEPIWISDAQRKIQCDVIDGQWRTLVESVRSAGSMQSSLAICDVSGSMFRPQFPDKSTPLHSAIGLSLLLAQVTHGPFSETIMSFTQEPRLHVLKVSHRRSDGFCDTVDYLREMDWGWDTDLVKAFELLLEKAKDFQTPPEEMVKQVFIFSDMQFDQGVDEERWTSSFDRIKSRYFDAGYDMPKLIFWNLAGKSSKPVTVSDSNTVLVSGYSPGMLRAFLETGALDGAEHVVEENVSDEEGMVEVRKVEKIDPLHVVKKAVDHQAYSMLKVVD
jgi:hypothetical protein